MSQRSPRPTCSLLYSVADYCTARAPKCFLSAYSGALQIAIIFATHLPAFTTSSLAPPRDTSVLSQLRTVKPLPRLTFRTKNIAHSLYSH